MIIDKSFLTKLIIDRSPIVLQEFGFQVNTPSFVSAGVAFLFTVTATNPDGSTNPAYSGTITFSSSDPLATVPMPSTISAGVGVFTAYLESFGLQSITATDSGVAIFNGTGSSIVQQGPVHFFINFGVSTVMAGVGHSFNVFATQGGGVIYPAYAGTIHFTASDSQAILPANTTLTAGTGNFSATLKTAGSRQTVTATDTITSSITGHNAPLSVSSGSPDHYLVGSPSSATSGVGFGFTVTRQDVFNNTSTGLTSSVVFSGTDTLEILPFSLTVPSIGVATASATLVTVGNQSFTATDSVTSSITGHTGTIAVAAATLGSFGINAPGNVTAAVPFLMTVTALTTGGVTDTAYTGTVQFSASDTSATVPSPSTLSLGVGVFSVTLRIGGLVEVTAADSVSPTINGSSLFRIQAGAATQFFLTTPATATSAIGFDFTVTAEDSVGNTASSYSGTMHFASTDSTATLPANVTMMNGSGDFTATLRAAGSQTLTVTDTIANTLTGNSSAITLAAGAATHFSVTTPTSATVGSPTTFTVTALDVSNATVTGYSGTVTFSCSNNAANLPAPHLLVNGIGAFGVTYNQAGTQVLTATDANSITGHSASVLVH